MTQNNLKTKGLDTGGLVISCLLIIFALVLMWDTTHMLDADSYIFPRAIAIAMIILNGLSIAFTFIKKQQIEKVQNTGASTPRRVLLIIGMLVACGLMPYLGFLISAVITFALLMFIAMYEEWTPKKKIIYPIVAVVLIIGFYLLFAKILMVPLPTGVFFE